MTHCPREDENGSAVGAIFIPKNGNGYSELFCAREAGLGDLQLFVLGQNLIREPVQPLEIRLLGVSLGHHRIEKL